MKKIALFAGICGVSLSLIACGGDTTGSTSTTGAGGADGSTTTTSAGGAGGESATGTSTTGTGGSASAPEAPEMVSAEKVAGGLHVTLKFGHLE